MVDIFGDPTFQYYYMGIQVIPETLIYALHKKQHSDHPRHSHNSCNYRKNVSISNDIVAGLLVQTLVRTILLQAHAKGVECAIAYHI